MLNQREINNSKKNYKKSADFKVEEVEDLTPQSFI